jgi:hypothetical protein
LVRIFGALVAGIAAIAWILERYFEKSNFVSEYVQIIANQSFGIVFGLAIFTLLYKTVSKNFYKKEF